MHQISASLVLPFACGCADHLVRVHGALLWARVEIRTARDAGAGPPATAGSAMVPGAFFGRREQVAVVAVRPQRPPTFPRVAHRIPSWPGSSRPSTSCLTRHGRAVPAIHALPRRSAKTWMPGSRPGMTGRGCRPGPSLRRHGRPHPVMAGPVPAIHVLPRPGCWKSWMPLPRAGHDVEVAGALLFRGRRPRRSPRLDAHQPSPVRGLTEGPHTSAARSASAA